MCRKVWGFESLRGHHKIPQKSRIPFKGLRLFSLQCRFYRIGQRLRRTADQLAQRTAVVKQRALGGGEVRVGQHVGNDRWQAHGHQQLTVLVLAQVVVRQFAAGLLGRLRCQFAQREGDRKSVV